MLNLIKTCLLADKQVWITKFRGEGAFAVLSSLFSNALFLCVFPQPRVEELWGYAAFWVGLVSSSAF
jgi:hypothetical protein